MDRDRTEIRKEPETAAQREERLLGTDRRIRVVPFRPADRAEQDRVRCSGSRYIAVADRDPVGVDGSAARQDLGPLDLEVMHLTRRVEDRPRSRDDLGSDAISGDGGDAVSRHEGSSTTRGDTNATETPLISAPRSLLTATR